MARLARAEQAAMTTVAPPKGGSLIGQSVLRIEDERHLTGTATFGADVNRRNQLYARIVRSPVAAGRITAVRVDAALAHPQVVAVFTAGDVPDVRIPPRLSPGERAVKVLQPVIARDEVRYVGEPVAMVVARDPYAAEDGAELVDVDIEPYQALVELDDAVSARARPIHSVLGGNEVDTVSVARGKVDAAFKAADVIVGSSFSVQRHGAVPLEPRALVAEEDPRDGRLTVWGVAKVKQANRRVLASLLDRDIESIRFYETDVGGSFGARGEFYPEDFLVPWAATMLKRPVKWVEDRGENLVALNQSREQQWTAEVAATAEGELLALRAQGLWGQGAYVRPHGNILLELTVYNMVGPYRWPAFEISQTGVILNKTPAGTYRGPGQFESSFIRERLIDMLAADIGRDPADVRRLNIVKPEQMPYAAGVPDIDTGDDTTYEGSDYPEVFEQCLARADYPALVADAKRRRARGELVGVGTSAFVEIGSPGSGDLVRIVPTPDARFVVHVGAAAVGQGMETVLTQIAAEELGVDMDRIEISYRNTDDVPEGLGAFSSRITAFTGNAVAGAVAVLHDRAREAGAARFGVSADEVAVAAGAVHPSGEEGSSIALGELGIEASFRYTPEPRSHVVMGANCVLVEIDPATGHPQVTRWVIAIDPGRVVNPLLLTGQVRGAAIQGLGGTFYEEFVYSEDGQPQSATFLGYLLPTAAEAPDIEVVLLELGSSRAHDDRLGIKGGGETGIVGTAAALANAVSDALGGAPLNSLPIRPYDICALATRSERTPQTPRAARA
jgi:aerobic carbon-monoxide dehydrogenase large subunit